MNISIGLFLLISKQVVLYVPTCVISGKKRKKRYGAIDRRGQIKNRVSIDARPPIVADKQRIGDWETDTIIGKGHQKAIVTLIDRVAKLTRIGPVITKHAESYSNS